MYSELSKITVCKYLHFIQRGERERGRERKRRGKNDKLRIKRNEDEMSIW